MGKFLHEQKHYAEVYGQTTRTIKRWVKTGRDAQGGPDLPPLDDSGRMVDWWARNYKHKVPDELLEAAKSAPERPIQPELSVQTGKKDTTAEIGTGFAEMLERVKRAEAAAYRQYDSALISGDEAKLPAARKVWGELSKQLRELERDSHDILSRSGTLFDRATAERVLAEIHLPIVNGIRSMWRRVSSRIRAATSDAEQDRIWQEECDRLLFRLNESAFKEAA